MRKTKKLTDFQKEAIRSTIKSWLRENNIEQKELAKKINVTSATVTRWVSLKRPNDGPMRPSHARILFEISNGKIPLEIMNPKTKK